MRKEFFIAVFIGLSLGLIITYGIYTARTSLSKNSGGTAVLPSVAPSASPEASTELVISNPEDESIQRDANITIAGTTWPKSFVVIFVNDKEHLTTAGENGDFSVQTKLQPAANVIAVHAVNEDGQSLVQERTVIFASDELPEATPAPTATPKPTTAPKPSPSPTTRPRTTQ